MVTQISHFASGVRRSKTKRHLPTIHTRKLLALFTQDVQVLANVARKKKWNQLLPTGVFFCIQQNDQRICAQMCFCVLCGLIKVLFTLSFTQGTPLNFLVLVNKQTSVRQPLVIDARRPSNSSNVTQKDRSTFSREA